MPLNLKIEFKDTFILKYKVMSHHMFYNDTVTLNDFWYESHKSLIINICMELKKTNKIDELLEKFLGLKMKIKTIKDPKHPKRPKSSYFHFCDEIRSEVTEKWKKNNSTSKIKIGEISKILGARWQKLTDDEKEKYTQLNCDDKIKYNDEMQKYKMGD